MVWGYTDQYQEYSEKLFSVEGSVSDEQLVPSAALEIEWQDQLSLVPDEGKPLLVCIQQGVTVLKFPTPGGQTDYDPLSASKHYPASDIRLVSSSNFTSLALEIRTEKIRLPDVHFIVDPDNNVTSYYERDINSAQRINTIKGGLFSSLTRIYSVRGGTFRLEARVVEIKADLAFFDGKVILLTENTFGTY